MYFSDECPACNRLWATDQFPPSQSKCHSCSQTGARKKPSQVKVQENEAGLMFRSALPEDLDWDTRVEDVALSMDAIKGCLTNMLMALDRDTLQTREGIAFPLACTEQEVMTAQETPWLWFTLPELGFPMIMDEYESPIHPEVEKYLRRYVTEKQDWETVDDEDC